MVDIPIGMNTLVQAHNTKFVEEKSAQSLAILLANIPNKQGVLLVPTKCMAENMRP